MALLELLQPVSLSRIRDVGRWELTKNKKYSTKSLYEAMLHSGVVDLRLCDLWKAKIPLKQKIFVWLSIRGRIQVTDELAKKGWLGELSCQLCGAAETADHLVFSCPIAFWVWCVIRDCFSWPRTPGSVEDFFFYFCMPRRGRKSNYNWWSLLAAVAWA